MVLTNRNVLTKLKSHLGLISSPLCLKIFRLSSGLVTKSDLTDSVKLSIEEEWKNSIAESSFREDSSKSKAYVLSMFPYPSGNLHMGHVRVYTIGDTIARFHRLQGKNVLHPIGFDAFGLPAENAAFENKLSANEWTQRNISSMRRQLKQLGFSFDWDREIITCLPSYYKFTQHLFLLLFKEGLVYRKEALVNWDPVDQTVLADEQVNDQGRSWRSGAIVEKKLLKQWFIRTTRFANSLREGLDDPRLEDWRDVVKLQKHWIGECDGYNFEFKLSNVETSSITVWTRHPEFIENTVFLAVAPGSMLDAERTQGTRKLDFDALNPFTNVKIPIFVTNEVTFDEGCDVRLGIPSAYESDKSFARSVGLRFDPATGVEDEAKRKRICDEAIELGVGGYKSSSKLRDWLISRQRKWGTPIPVVHCPSCGEVPSRSEDLPVLLPDSDSNHHPAVCPNCQSEGVWETDTMDTFVDSSWYFLRYTDPHNTEQPFNKEELNRLMPVDVYVGGKEHAVLHLYYARFIGHFLHSIGILKEPEPFKKLVVQGMVMGKTYQVAETGKFIAKENVDFSGDTLVESGTGLKVKETWDKMSKSKYNGVEPSEVLKKHGIDTTRLLILCDVAPTSNKYWAEDDFPGILNWQRKIWSLMADFVSARETLRQVEDPAKLEKENALLWDARNYYTKGVTFNYSGSHQLSVAISKLQGLTKSLRRISKESMSLSAEFERTLGALLIMLAPMTPHFCSHLWSELQLAQHRLDSRNQHFLWDRPVLEQTWPVLDDAYDLELICKVNNAVKSSVKLPFSRFKILTSDEALSLALAERQVKKFIKGRDILQTHFSIVESYGATVNLLIDHRESKEK